MVGLALLTRVSQYPNSLVHVQELVQVDTSVGELSEGTLLAVMYLE